jgi:hypothetical protein
MVTAKVRWRALGVTSLSVSRSERGGRLISSFLHLAPANPEWEGDEPKLQMRRKKRREV